MATEVDICNMGLSMLGTNPIATFNDGTTEANLCKLWYPLLRDAVLEARAWTFATVRFQATSGTPPDPIPAGWAYGFLVPTDCLRIIQVYTPNPTGAVAEYIYNQQFDALYTPVSWERLKNYFYTNVGPTTWVKYIQRVTDTSQFDSAFMQALAARIAAELAMPITNNIGMEKQKMEYYAAKVADASSQEGQQGTTQVLQGRTLALSRQ